MLGAVPVATTVTVVVAVLSTGAVTVVVVSELVLLLPELLLPELLLPVLLLAELLLGQTAAVSAVEQALLLLLVTAAVPAVAAPDPNSASAFVPLVDPIATELVDPTVSDVMSTLLPETEAVAAEGKLQSA